MLQSSEFPGTLEQLTSIIDAVPTGVILTDRSGRIVMVSRPVERMFGYAGHELIGQLVDILLPRHLTAEHSRLRERFLDQPLARPMGAGRELHGLCKDGHEVPIEIGLSPMQTASGLYVLAAIADITERRRLEARFRATVEAAPTAIVMADPAGNIVMVNRETERLFGYARSELLSLKVEALIPSRFRTTHPTLRAGYLAEPQTRRMGEGRDLYGLRKDSSELPIEIGLSPMHMDGGTFVLCAIVDISERAQTKALRDAVGQLEHSNRELQRFAYVASHDLQTPMRSIAGFVELLGKTYAEQLDDQARDWIRRTTAAVHHLQRLVRDLLAYSRVDTSSGRFDSVPMEGVLDAALSLLDYDLREAGALVSRDELPVVPGDRVQLVQLMSNLIGNAIKYRTGPSPRIHVGVKPDGYFWVFSVRDNGIGIEPRHHERIFEIFQRLHGNNEYPGTGIGLAICRRVVNRHGGRIWVESTAGAGSNFLFTIPNAQGTQS